MWPFEKNIELKKKMEPENELITFSPSDNDFERSRKMLRFSGLMNPNRLGLADGIAEALAIYRNLDLKFSEQSNNAVPQSAEIGLYGYAYEISKQRCSPIERQGGMMTIIKDGIDVTSTIEAMAETRAKLQRIKYNNFEQTKILLLRASISLTDIPPPWMDDCIYDAIQKIKEAVEILK